MSREIREMIDKIKAFKQSINENVENEKQFVVEQHTFKLLVNNVLVAQTKYNVEQQDEFFNEKYISVYELETFEYFRGKGYAKDLLNEIFNYVKDSLKLNIITLIVDKDNTNAVNLYFNSGFDIFMEYEDSYSLLKKL